MNPDTAVRLDRALAHRGPDGRGSFSSASGRALLVHRRLAIIDPSSGSDQPMADATGRWRLVYNGEIYNYRELRDDLALEGIRFTTTGDTEVMLALVVQRGPGALSAARGMFALALWDEEEQSLLVARDRFGIKPLYVARERERVVFGSELRALREAGCTQAVSAAAVVAFLRWGSVTPPLGWRERVESLEPGTWCRWDRNGRQTTARFAGLSWSRAIGAASRRHDRDVEGVVTAAIQDSVDAHLVSDVPVALFLSGGLDSATLLASATDRGQRPECFTVTDTAHRDEGAAAQAIARSFGATWRPLHVDAHGVSVTISQAVHALDQPSIDGPNSWVIAGEVARAGVKTALSGTGADEMFGGYPASRLIPFWQRLGAATPLAARSLASVERLRRHPTRAARLDHVAATNALAERYRAVRGFLLPAELSAIAGPRLSGSAGAVAAAQVDAIEAQLLATGDESVRAAVARAETQMYLRSQLLRDLDAMSMAHGLEVRVPFVDHVLLETTWPLIERVPHLLRRKRILRRLLKERVPARVLARPKTGFTLPFDAWMRRELRDFTRAGIQAAERSGWIAANAGDRIWSEWEHGLQHWSRPWGLSVLGHHAGQE